MLITIDSHPIIWGIKQQASAGQEHMIEKAKSFFRWADENNHKILIPSVVLAEILTPESDQEVERIMDILSKKFIIAPFDIKTSKIYSRLLRDRFQDLKSFIKENDIRRDKMKFDHIIIATAIAYNSTKIISNDSDLIQFSNGIIKVSNLENSFTDTSSSEQLSLL